MKSVRVSVFSLAVLLLAFLSLSPLFFAASNGYIDNSRGYYEYMFAADNARLVSHQGFLQEQHGITQIGSLAYNHTSDATFEFNFWQGTSFTQIARNVSDASLHFTIQDALFASIQPLILGKPAWTVDEFTSDWNQNWRQFAGTEASVRILNGTVDMSMNFSGRQRIDALFKTTLPNISTTEFPFLLVTWKSTDHVARLVAYTSSGDDYKILAQSADGTIYPGTVGGAYNPDWITIPFKFPPNKILTALEMGLDSGGGAGGPFLVNGTQHVYFSRIWIGNAIPKSSIKVLFNNQTVLNSELIYPTRNDLYTWNEARYGRINNIQMPLNTSSIALHNYIRVSVGPNTTVTLASAAIRMLTHTEKVKVPYISHIPQVLVIIAAIAGVLANLILTISLSKRLFTLDQSNLKEKKISQ